MHPQRKIMGARTEENDQRQAEKSPSGQSRLKRSTTLGDNYHGPPSGPSTKLITKTVSTTPPATPDKLSDSTVAKNWGWADDWSDDTELHGEQERDPHGQAWASQRQFATPNSGHTPNSGSYGQISPNRRGNISGRGYTKGSTKNPYNVQWNGLQFVRSPSISSDCSTGSLHSPTDGNSSVAPSDSRASATGAPTPIGHTTATSIDGDTTNPPTSIPANGSDGNNEGTTPPPPIPPTPRDDPPAGDGDSPGKDSGNDDKDKDDDGFKPVLPKQDKPLKGAIQSKKYITGIRLECIAHHANAGWHPNDLKYFLELVAAIDPKAITMNSRCEFSSAKSLASLSTRTSFDFGKYCDTRNIQWGKASDGKFKVYFSLYVASDIISKSLKELKEDTDIKAFLQAGKCFLVPHQLHESVTKVVGYFFGKDIRHTYRDDLRERLKRHINYSKTGPPSSIPVQIIVTQAGAGDFVTPMCAAVVGERDYKNVLSILDSRPLPNLEIILHQWKRDNSDQFLEKVKQHAMTVAESSAFKLSAMCGYHIELMRQAVLAEPLTSFIVDIPTTSHTHTSGVAYVQHFKQHKAEVLQWLEPYLVQLHKDCPDAQFPDGPLLVHTAGSKAMTKRSTATVASLSDKPALPPSRFAKTIINSNAKAPMSRKRAPIFTPPKSINTNIKSFSEALQGINKSTADPATAAGTEDTAGTASTPAPTDDASAGLSSLGHSLDAGDEASHVTHATQTTDNRSSKSIYEKQLEEENASLKKKLQEANQHHTITLQQLKALQQQHNTVTQQQDSAALEMTALKETVAALQRQMEAFSSNPNKTARPTNPPLPAAEAPPETPSGKSPPPKKQHTEPPEPAIPVQPQQLFEPSDDGGFQVDLQNTGSSQTDGHIQSKDVGPAHHSS